MLLTAGRSALPMDVSPVRRMDRGASLSKQRRLKYQLGQGGGLSALASVSRLSESAHARTRSRRSEPQEALMATVLECVPPGPRPSGRPPRPQGPCDTPLAYGQSYQN
jgi:hypothetical protein